MKIISLSEIADLEAGSGFPVNCQGETSGDLAFAKVSDISNVVRSGNRHIKSAKNYISRQKAKELKAKVFPPGTIVFAKIGEAIKGNMRAMTTCEMLFDNNVMGISSTSKEIDRIFLFHFLNTLDFYLFANKTSVPALRKSDLQRIQVPLPPIAQQKRIAAILDKAEELRGLRRKALGELDAIVQSIFLEMFGDPVANLKGWLKVKLGSVGTVQGGLQISASRAKLPCKVPYLRVANVYRDTLDLSEIKMMSATELEVARTLLEVNDLLIVEGHGNPTEIGRCALWDGSIPQCTHQNHLIRLRFDLAQVDPIFASRYLNSTGGRRDLLRAGKTTSGLNTINVSNVRDVQLLLPPLPLQQEFARRVEAIEHLKTIHRESLAQLDALFASLQHRAFQGEL